jgi:hypothetical protein
LSFRACWTWRTCGSAEADAWEDMPDWELLALAGWLALLEADWLVDAWLVLEADLLVDAWLALEAGLLVDAWLALLEAGWLLEAIEAWLDEEPSAFFSVE